MRLYLIVDGNLKDRPSMMKANMIGLFRGDGIQDMIDQVIDQIRDRGSCEPTATINPDRNSAEVSCKHGHYTIYDLGSYRLSIAPGIIEEH